MDTPQFYSDPLHNAFYQGIKRGISLTFDHHCYGSCLILIYSGIDAMALLGRPLSQLEVQRADFIAWADRYIRFPCAEQVTGEELYSARCALVHTYGVESRGTRQGLRRIGYSDRTIPEVVVNPAIDPTLVMLSIAGLRDAFFAGVDRFLIDVFSDEARRPDAEARLRQLMNTIPYQPPV